MSIQKFLNRSGLGRAAKFFGGVGLASLLFPQGLEMAQSANFSKQVRSSLTLSQKVSHVSPAQHGSVSASAVQDSTGHPKPQSNQQIANHVADTDWGPRPRRRTSGGDRNGCESPLIALVPGHGEVSLDPNECKTSSFSDLGQTSMASPIVWFYIPLEAQSIEGKLVILKDGLPVHTHQMKMTYSNGIVPIRFNYELDPNQTYDWVFSLLETPDYPTDNPTVEGSIKYLPQVQDPLPQDQLHALALDYCNNPKNPALQSSWQDLLKSMELSGMASVQILTCDPLAPKTP